MRKIYLAGTGVFRPDAVEYGKWQKRICSDHGFEGLYPLDNECEGAGEIFEANTAMIRECDIIAADMNDFRGNEPDSGTSFELGYACALGKRLYIYRGSSDTLRQRLGCSDENGMIVEDFGFPVNLMAAVPSVMVFGGFEECLRKISEDEGSISE